MQESSGARAAGRRSGGTADSLRRAAGVGCLCLVDTSWSRGWRRIIAANSRFPCGLPFIHDRDSGLGSLRPAGLTDRAAVSSCAPKCVWGIPHRVQGRGLLPAGLRLSACRGRDRCLARG